MTKREILRQELIEYTKEINQIIHEDHNFAHCDFGNHSLCSNEVIKYVTTRMASNYKKLGYSPLEAAEQIYGEPMAYVRADRKIPYRWGFGSVIPEHVRIANEKIMNGEVEFIYNNI